MRIHIVVGAGSARAIVAARPFQKPRAQVPLLLLKRLRED
jgi:hypothetical protein